MKIPVSKTYALVDDDSPFANLKWHLDSDGYAINFETRKRMHQFILKSVDKGKEIDHINGNRLDNRRANLRAASHKTNEGSEKTV